MFKIKLIAQLPQLRQGYSDTCRRYVMQQLRQAAREFVREAIVNIPVETGQARGTFLPLGRFLNVSVDISDANPLANKNEYTGSMSDKKLVFKFSDTAKGASFEVAPQLLYFIYNDLFAHNYPNEQIPTPWESIQKGWDAFEEYTHNVAPIKFPRITTFIEKVTKDYGY